MLLRRLTLLNIYPERIHIRNFENKITIGVKISFNSLHKRIQVGYMFNKVKRRNNIKFQIRLKLFNSAKVDRNPSNCACINVCGINIKPLSFIGSCSCQLKEMSLPTTDIQQGFTQIRSYYRLN